MAEAQRRRVVEDPGARELGGERDRLGEREPGELGGGVELDVLAEHGRRARQRARRSAEPVERRPDAARDVGGVTAVIRSAVAASASIAVGEQRAHELAEQQRVAAGGVVAGLREPRATGPPDERWSRSSTACADSGRGVSSSVAASPRISASASGAAVASSARARR